MTTIPGVDVEALKAAAEKAHPGPWKADRNGVHTARGECVAITYSAISGYDFQICRGNAAFIALASPAAVLALITALEDATEEIEDLRWHTFPKTWAGFKAFLDHVYPDDIFPDDDRDLGPQFVVAARRLAVVEAERDGLQRQVDAVRQAWDNAAWGDYGDHTGMSWLESNELCDAIDAALAAAAAPVEGQETHE